MKYFTVLFASPLYFAIRGKWGAFVLNSVLYVTALLTLIFGVGVFFWLLGVGHASWHLRTELMEEHAAIMARKFAEEMRKPSGV